MQGESCGLRMELGEHRPERELEGEIEEIPEKQEAARRCCCHGRWGNETQGYQPTQRSATERTTKIEVAESVREGKGSW